MRWPHLVLLLPVGGCFAVRPAPLPVADALMERTMVSMPSTRCLVSRCRSTVSIGRERLLVETSARLMSVDEALGERRSLTTRLLLGVAKEVLLMSGVGVGQDRIGLGTRVVTVGGDSSSRLRCTLGWVQEEMRTRNDGRDETITRRLSEGMDCEVVLAPDSLVTWRFHTGVSPTPASLAKTSGTRRSNPERYRLDMRLRLEQVTGAGEIAYGFVLDSVTTSVMHAPLSVWGLVRPDGTRVGTLVWRFGVAKQALDVSASATSDERRVFQLLVAALVAPLFESG